MRQTCWWPWLRRGRCYCRQEIRICGPIREGEFLSAVAAGPVYKLLGKDALDTETWPEAKKPILHDLSYYMHDGGHGMVPTDWDIYVQFLKMHLHPER